MIFPLGVRGKSKVGDDMPDKPFATFSVSFDPDEFPKFFFPILIILALLAWLVLPQAMDSMKFALLTLSFYGSLGDLMAGGRIMQTVINTITTIWPKAPDNFLFLVLCAIMLALGWLFVSTLGTDLMSAPVIVLAFSYCIAGTISSLLYGMKKTVITRKY